MPTRSVIDRPLPARRTVPVVLAMSLALAGCEGTAALSTASLPTSIGLSSHSGVYQSSTMETYARIARGAKTCWFGPAKPLARSHIFHGELAPDTKGGAGEIGVHRRSADQPSPRAGRVFVIAIARVGDGASVTIENRHLPEPMAELMRADIQRWARTGGNECSRLAEVAPDLSPPPPLPARKPALPVTSPRKKR